MINIFIVLIMYIPFYVSLWYKHTTTLTKVLVFVWCAACSAMMILNVIVACVYTLTGSMPFVLILSIIGWLVLDMFIGIKAVLSDTPK